MSNRTPKPRDGYELVAFFTANDKEGERKARKKASQYKHFFPDMGEYSLEPESLAYIHETEEGFFVFATRDIKYTFPKSVQEWLDTPLETHIERWKKINETLKNSF